MNDAAAEAIFSIIGTARRPLLVAGPHLANRSGRALLARIEAALAIPTCIMESPRGFNDATLGAFAEVARRTDLIVLLGKAFDFTLKFGGPPIDPGLPVHFDRSRRRAGRTRGEGTRPSPGVRLRRRYAAGGGNPASGWPAMPAAGWLTEARALMNDRPASWAD